MSERFQMQLKWMSINCVESLSINDHMTYPFDTCKVMYRWNKYKKKHKQMASCGQGGRQDVHSFAVRRFHHQIEAALHSSEAEGHVFLPFFFHHPPFSSFISLLSSPSPSDLHGRISGFSPEAISINRPSIAAA